MGKQAPKGPAMARVEAAIGAAAPPDAVAKAQGDGARAASGATDAPPVPYWKLYSTADALDWVLVVLGFIGAVGNGVMLPLFSLLFGSFTQTFGSYFPACLGPPPPGFPGAISDREFRSQISGVALQFLYLALGAAALGALQQGCWMYTSTRQSNRLRRMYLRAVLRQDIGFFDTQATTGGLLQGLNEDSLAVQAAMSDKVGQFLQQSTTFVAGYVLAFIKGWDVTLILCACLPFLAGAGALLARASTSANTRSQDAYTEAGAVVQQSVSQIRTVAAYNGEGRAQEQYNALLDAPQRIGKALGLMSGLSLGAMQFVMFCSYAVALLYGANRIAAGKYTGGDVLSVIIASLIGSFSLGLAGPILQQFSKGQAAGGRMFSVLERAPAIDGEQGGLEPAEVKGEIELQHVTFAYPARPDALVFHDFSLKVPAGKTVALVGSSGSGKSTVVGLIERYYDPLAGRVTLDGADLRSLNLKWLRQQVGLVSQEPTLFMTTIFENIALGKPGATREEVESAARSANALGFISHLPLGFDTQVGERGVQLSGGQKQRIAIARAILKNPKILLLDEATSALDVASERVVQAALDALVVGRTTVVVAHRLSTIKDADIIAVVKEGAVVEMGSHDDLLLDAAGHYSTLVKLQLQATEQEVAVEAELEEVRESGAPVTRASVDKVESRRRSLELARLSARGSSGRRVSAEAPALQSTTSAAEDDPDYVPLPPPAAGAIGHGRGSRELQAVVVHAAPAAAPAPASAPAAPDAAAAAGGGPLACLRRRKPAGAEGGEEAGQDAGAKGGEAAAKKVPFSRLLALNKPEWPWAVLGSLGSAVAGAVQPAFAFTLVSMIVAFYAPPDQIKAKASMYAWIFFGIACAILLATLLQQWSFAIMGQALARRVRVALFGAILRQDIGWFDRDENSSGRLATLLSTDAAYVRGAVGDVFGATIQNLAVLGVGYVIAFAYNWRMALVVTGAAPFIAVGGMLQMKYMMGASSHTDKYYSSANQAVTEAVASIRVIHAYNLQGYVTSSYASMLHRVNALARRTSIVGGAALAYSMFAMFAVYSLITWFGGEEVASCRSSFDGFFKAFMCVLFAAMGLSQVQMGFPDLAKAQAAVQRVFPVIDRAPPIDASDPGGEAPAAVKGEIELEAVTFAYPSRPNVVVFNSFSLRVPAGKTVALVGESGSGKSTVVGLIERYYDPLAGQVTLDGADLRSLNLKWLRQQIGLVSQEPLLFAGTVSDNITYGAPGASMEQVEAAARAANAHDFITALPDGYATRVGERGVQLSGGQKQRVAIARAVVKEPRVMLLDEATSALDSASERAVQDALDRISVGRTTIVVAHRLSTIRNADVIAVVYRGVILEQGTHEELMALPNGGYARMVASQARGGGGGGGSEGGKGGGGGGGKDAGAA